MSTLLKGFKTEIKPTAEQKQIINRTIGTCRYVYNSFLAHNKEVYDKDGTYVSGIDFSKWLNNEYIPENPDKSWIKDVSAKSVKQSILNAHTAFKRFFNKKSAYPNFKKKNISEPKMYFVKNDAKTVIQCERHRIKIPTLGWVRLKEKAYIPTDMIIRSGTVSKQAGRYYVSVLVDVPEPEKWPLTDTGLGIDLGLTEFAVMSDGTRKKNINKSKRVKKLNKKLRREQRKLSRKHESLKKRNKSITEGRATQQNIQKQKLKVQKVHQRLTNIRTDYINKTIYDVVKTKPNHITMEDLNVSGMMKNKHLSKAVAQQKFYEFRLKLTVKCNQRGIQLRVVDRWYPSSRLCHKCGHIKKDLKLSDRVYICSECGYQADRDYNASLNLRDAKIYKVAH